MKIAIVSKLWERISPDSTGGTGASIGNLVNGLVEKGHKVTLFATGDSKTKAQKLISVKNKPYKGDYSEIKEYQNISEAFKRHKDFDLIHCAVEHKSLFFGDLVKTPSLHSIRYGEFFKDELNLLKQNKKLNFVANSKALQKKFSFLNWKGIVYNGLDYKLFPYNETPKDYLLFLARVSPQKGPDIAIKLAKKLKMNLIIAGKMVEADYEYLKKQVLPHIDNKKIVYLGEVGFKEKLELLKNAKALIQPIDYFEACSNTILEAAACGTPTITYNKGSNKELIENGKTGFVVNNFEQLLSKTKQINKLNRLDCRRRIETVFNLDQMVEGYEKIYKKILK